MESSKVFISVFKWIFNNCTQWLSSKLNDNWSANRIEWIITVPTIWNDESKYLMKKWGNLSGLDNIRIVYESDCASLAMQYQLNTSKKPHYDIKTNTISSDESDSVQLTPTKLNCNKSITNL